MKKPMINHSDFAGLSDKDFAMLKRLPAKHLSALLNDPEGWIATDAHAQQYERAKAQAETFSTGRIVRLRSGGPDMTVTRYAESGFVEAQWFDGNINLNTGSFPATGLDMKPGQTL